MNGDARRIRVGLPGLRWARSVRNPGWTPLANRCDKQSFPLRAATTDSRARLEPGKATRAWRSLLRSLRGLIPKECPFEAGAARDVTHGMLEAARGSVLTASEIHRRAASEIQRRAQRFRSPVRGESVASTRLESSDSGHRPRPSQEQLPPTFRRLLNDIGADD